MPPLGTTHYLSPGGWGCQKILGRITQFSVVTERGSEYNIVEKEDSRNVTASEGGGCYYNITEPLRWGRGAEERIKQILSDTTKTIPSPPSLAIKSERPISKWRFKALNVFSLPVRHRSS